MLFTLTLILGFESNAEPVPGKEITLDEAEKESSLMPTYGNWCGPNHPQNILNASAPVDTLDTICQKHDICYAQTGYIACECDKQFNAEISSGLKNGSLKWREKIFARSFLLYFKGSPCLGDFSDKLAPSRAIHNVVKKIGATTETLVDKIPFVGD